MQNARLGFHAASKYTAKTTTTKVAARSLSSNSRGAVTGYGTWISTRNQVGLLSNSYSTRSTQSGIIRWQHTDSRRSSVDIDRDFILSILQAQPSARDSRSYLKAFGSDQRQQTAQHGAAKPSSTQAENDEDGEIKVTSLNAPSSDKTETGKDTTLVDALLDPITRHTAVVKVQGPFNDRQLSSIAEGLVYLDRLGLVSIVVVDDESWSSTGHIGSNASSLRKEMVRMSVSLAEALEEKGGKAIPLVNDLFRLGQSTGMLEDGNATVAAVENLRSLKAAIGRGEIPVIPPIAYDRDLAAVAVHANDAIKALVAALAKEGDRISSGEGSKGKMSKLDRKISDIDLTPMRMMVINREGGVPSPARGGNPHLSINLESEFDYIHDTFIWQQSHPTSLANLDLIRSCLAQLPRDSSAVLVSHRSPRALIANLITNRPAHSPSLHHSLLPAKHIQHTPTIVRKGLPIRVIRDVRHVDKTKLTALLEASFRKTLKADEYYSRLERDADFIIVAGYSGTERDYQAAAIVTLEKDPLDPLSSSSSPISYLDKFAVLPSLQGDGTVDFLWTALRDETFGLGLLDALNPNPGGKQGIGHGTDLVWRSRSDNPVNKWYFERSNGFVNIPEMGKGGTPGTMFWSDAEDRVTRELQEEQEGRGGERRSVSMVMQEEEGRLERWARVIGGIKSCWK